MLRKLTAVPIVLVLILALAPTAAAAEASTGRGTAKTTIDLLDVKVDLSGLKALQAALPGLVDTKLGVGQTFASTDTDAARNSLGEGKPFALAQLKLPVVGDVTARSDGESKQPGKQVALPAGLGGLNLGGLQATVDGATAQSLVNLLSGNVNATLAGIEAAIPAKAVNTTVDLGGASALNGAAIQNFSLKLGDLLPADLLKELPLETLLELLKGLPLDLGALEGVIGQLDAVVKQAKVVEAALPALSKQAGAITTQLNNTLVQLENALGTGTLARADVEKLIADLDKLQLSTDQLTVDLSGTLKGLVTELTALQGLDLAKLLDDLLGDLAGLELLGIDNVSVGLTAVADPMNSKATGLCDVSGVRVLGQKVDAVDTCAQLRGALDTLRQTLLGVLTALPVVGEVTSGLVTVDGLVVTTTPEGATAGTYRTAHASLTGLTIALNSVKLEDAVSGLVGDLTALLESLLGGVLTNLLSGDLGVVVGGNVGNLLGGDLSKLLEGGLSGLSAGLTTLSSQLGQVEPNESQNYSPGVQDVVQRASDFLAGRSASPLAAGLDLSAVTGLLEGVLGLVGGLPTGDLLGGLSTPAVSLKALELTAASEFVTPMAVPAGPVPQTDLPRTGGGAGAGAAGLLLLVVGGSAAAFLVRRRTAIA